MPWKKQQELTLRAIFLSFFIAENCFKRLKTAESRGLSGASSSTWIQGWPARNHNKHNQKRYILLYVNIKLNSHMFIRYTNSSNVCMESPPSYPKTLKVLLFLCFISFHMLLFRFSFFFFFLAENVSFYSQATMTCDARHPSFHI